MTGQQATAILTQLAYAYPRFDMNGEASGFYRRMLAELDFRVAERAVLIWVREEKWFPAVAEFRETCRRARRDMETEKRLNAEEKPPEKPTEIPEWTHVWFWNMQRTRLERQMLNTTSRKPVAERTPVKMRDFPQMENPYPSDGGEATFAGPDAYSLAEYELIRSEWAAAGSPRLRSTAEMFAAVTAKA